MAEFYPTIKAELGKGGLRFGEAVTFLFPAAPCVFYMPPRQALNGYNIIAQAKAHKVRVAGEKILSRRLYALARLPCDRLFCAVMAGAGLDLYEDDQIFVQADKINLAAFAAKAMGQQAIAFEL